MHNEPEKQEFYHDLGEDYFWLSGHYDVIEYLLKQFVVGKEKQILDAGCGPGNFISRIKNIYSVIGVDYSEKGLHFCREKHRTQVFSSSLDALGIKSESFDGLVSLEVLEHLQYDVQALAEYCRVMKPGAIGIVTVPAFQFLYGPHDEWFGHVRRYSRKELAQKMRQAGFRVVRCEYFKCVFFFPMWMLRFLKRLAHQYQEVKTDYIPVPSQWVNQLLRWWVFFEVKSGFNRLFPFGTHLVCVFEKPRK